MSTDKLALARRLAAYQRAELAEIQYAIEIEADELSALYERRQSAAEALESTEKYIERKERDIHYNENHER